MAGMIPVEMLGFTEFPAIGKASYRLTLGPYAFFWFELQASLNRLRPASRWKPWRKAR